jgi:hypothetical protein
MGLLRRKAEDGDRTEVQTERTGTSPGLIRALMTLLGVAVAGFLVWLASEIADGSLADATNGDFWIAVALLAGAGLALGLSQLLGGWTKWGWPRLSPTVFLLGFLPTLVVGGWILLAKQPQDGVEEGRFDGWSGDLGISGLVNDLALLLPVIPLIIGLVLAFSFDTTGPRTHRVVRDSGVPDEDAHDYRRERDRPLATPVGATTDRTLTTDRTAVADRPAETTGATRSSTVAEELRHRDDRAEVAGGGSHVERDETDRRTTI